MRVAIVPATHCVAQGVEERLRQQTRIDVVGERLACNRGEPGRRPRLHL